MMIKNISAIHVSVSVIVVAWAVQDSWNYSPHRIFKNVLLGFSASRSLPNISKTSQPGSLTRDWFHFIALPSFFNSPE